MRKKTIKEKILDFISKQEKDVIGVKSISEALKIAYPTALKYVDILTAEGEIDVVNYGNVKIIRLGSKEE